MAAFVRQFPWAWGAIAFAASFVIGKLINPQHEAITGPLGIAIAVLSLGVLLFILLLPFAGSLCGIRAR